MPIQQKIFQEKYLIKRFFIIILCTTFIAKTNHELANKETAKNILEEIFLEDQELLNNVLNYMQSSQEGIEDVMQRFGVKEQNAHHCELLKEIIAFHGWPTLSEFGQEAGLHAWIIVQHADHDVAFQKKCLNHMKQLIAHNEVEKKWIAYLYDRIKINQKKPQRYGTQVDYKTGLPKPLEDPLNVDKYRAQMGLKSLDEHLDFFNNHYKKKDH